MVFPAPTEEQENNEFVKKTKVNWKLVVASVVSFFNTRYVEQPSIIMKDNNTLV